MTQHELHELRNTLFYTRTRVEIMFSNSCYSCRPEKCPAMTVKNADPSRCPGCGYHAQDCKTAP